MPWLPIPADHCQTAADVREQCRHAVVARHKTRSIKGWVRINGQWVSRRKLGLPAPPPPRPTRPDPGFIERDDHIGRRIINAVKMHFMCEEEDIFLGPKGSTAADARLVSLYLIRKTKGLSLVKAALQFGLSESSARNACLRVEALLKMDPHHTISAAVTQVQRHLEAPA